MQHQKRMVENMSSILEFNYDIWKNSIENREWKFLFHVNNKDTSLLFLNKLLNDKTLTDDDIVVYGQIFTRACYFLRHDIIDIFLKNSHRLCKWYTTFIANYTYKLNEGIELDFCIRNYACRNIFTPLDLIGMGDEYYVFGRDSSAYVRCLSLILDVDYPKQSLLHKSVPDGNLLICAIKSRAHVEVCSLLIEKGCNPYEKHKITYGLQHTIVINANAVEIAEMFGEPDVKIFFHNYSRKECDLFSLMYGVVGDQQP